MKVLKDELKVIRVVTVDDVYSDGEDSLWDRSPLGLEPNPLFKDALVIQADNGNIVFLFPMSGAEAKDFIAGLPDANVQPEQSPLCGAEAKVVVKESDNGRKVTVNIYT